MKKFTLLIAAILFVVTGIMAQTPNQFKYQAVLREANGAIMTTQNVIVDVSILQGSASGTSVFTEQHNVTTTAQGLINLNIGSVSDLSTVDFSADTYFIEISVNGTVMGTSQLLSVPYALQAQNAENFSGTITESQISDFGTYLTNEADSSVTNEIQNLSQVLTQDNSAGNARITNLAEPENAQDVATKSYVDLLETRIFALENKDLQDNVKIIKSDEATFESDSTQQAAGVYIFEYFNTTQIFQAGDVIVGQFGYGFLRKVVSSETSGNTVTLQTEQATFEDLYKNCQLISFSMPYTDSTKSASDFLAKGVTETSGEGINLSLSDISLYSGSNVDVKLVTASLNINPAFKLNLIVNDGEFQGVSFVSENTPFEFEYNLAVNGTVSESTSFEKTLFEENNTIYIPIAGFPVPIGYINHKIKLVFTPTASAGIDYNYNAITKYSFDIGAEYANDSFNSIFAKKSEVKSVVNNTLDVRAGGSLKLSVIYEPTFYPFAEKGPYLINDLNGTVSGAINTSLDWNLALDIAMSTTAGIDLSVFSDSLETVEYSHEWFNVNLYTVPYIASIVSGNNQTGTYQTVLDEPVKIQVKDNLGFAIPNVKVYFEPLTDCGTTADAFVLTDTVGYAQTDWTLGEIAGEQELKVFVKNADGSYINGCPITFKAIAGCGLYMLDGYEVVDIGNQTWMTHNMAEPSGTYVTEDSIWAALPDNDTAAAYCFRNNDSTSFYGAYYTYAAAINVCPAGWHLPTDTEWTELTDYLGGQSVAGGELKSLSGWNYPNTGATNYTCFSAFGGSLRNGEGGGFSGTGYDGWWWSTDDASTPWVRTLSYSSTYVDRWTDGHWSNGYSVRCIHD